MPYLVLPSSHYASSWSADREIRDYETVTNVGVAYVNETDPARKQELLLELVRFFHAYLIKYTTMIVSGVLPRNGNSINSDAKNLLRFFLPKGVRASSISLGRVARSLRLAFKDMPAEEVYDTLVVCLIKAFEKYDPTYTQKVKAVSEAIDSLNEPTFTSGQITEITGFVSNPICKMLLKRGHLIKSEADARITHYKKADWPIDPKMFERRIDIPYFVSYYFRQYLLQYITKEMRTLEARKTMMQLEHRKPVRMEFDGKTHNGELRIPSADGNLQDAQGRRWMADCTLMERDADVGTLSLDWVNETSDPLFKNLSKTERMILYLLHAKSFTRPQVCQAVGMTTSEYERVFTALMAKLRQKAGVRSI